MDHYSRKMHKFFTLLDADGDSVLTFADFTAAAGRAAQAFGWSPSSDQSVAIRQSYAALWTEVYAPMDLDGDAGLDFGEYLAAHQKTILGLPDGYQRVQPVSQAFLQLADTDGDGVISREEYVATMNSAFGLSHEDGHHAFDQLDTEGKGALSFGEVHRAVEGYFCSDNPETYGSALLGRV
ncbi:EF-hand domain-containing protein [Herbidospora cretacea]|uniref:EF-hand domain-containing protein n=1 Tax=Herbidospora cretacea TaxID=28444 RepID=UPI000774CB4D|nr:EF-hand domain-containing protein [Herbidospora cretacea]